MLEGTEILWSEYLEFTVYNRVTKSGDFFATLFNPPLTFLIYSLYSDQNISVWIIDGRNKQNCVFAVEHSIINRTSQTNVGSLMLKYGGGGHKVVGTCQVPYDDADKVLNELLLEITTDN